jgi:hypothetical protein
MNLLDEILVSTDDGLTYAFCVITKKNATTDITGTYHARIMVSSMEILFVSSLEILRICFLDAMYIRSCIKDI